MTGEKGTGSTRYSFVGEDKRGESTREMAALGRPRRKSREGMIPTQHGPLGPLDEPLAGKGQSGSLEETTGEKALDEAKGGNAKEQKKPGRGTLVPTAKQIKKEKNDMVSVEEAVRSAIPGRFPMLSEKFVAELATAKDRATHVTDRSPKQEFVASFVSPDLVELVLKQYLKFDTAEKQKAKKPADASTE